MCQNFVFGSWSITLQLHFRRSRGFTVRQRIVSLEPHQLGILEFEELSNVFGYMHRFSTCLSDV